MGPNSGLDHSGNIHVRDIAHFERQLSSAPESRPVRGLLLQCLLENLSFFALTLGAGDSAGNGAIQTGQSLGHKALFQTVKLVSRLSCWRIAPRLTAVADQKNEASTARLRRVSALSLTQRDNTSAVSKKAMDPANSRGRTGGLPTSNVSC